MKVQINEFKGIMPKLASDKLPANMAQIASDLKTASGELVAVRASSADVSLAGDAYQSLFQYVEGANTHWVYTNDVNYAVRSPVPEDTFERMYWLGTDPIAAVGTITFTDGMTDGETITIGTETFEFDVPPDGVAGTNTVVDVSADQDKEPVAAVLAALTPDADITFTDNLDGTITVTANVAGSTGNSIVFTESGAHITVDGSGFLGGTTEGESDYRAFSNDINSGPWDFLVDYYHPGAPSGTAPTITPTVAGATYLAYYYAYVSRYGEEGPGSAITEITNQTVGSRVQVDDIPTPPAGCALQTTVGDYAPKVRIYRTATDGSGGSEFLLVCEADWFSASVDYAVGDYTIYANDLWECTTVHPAAAWNAAHFTQGEDVAVTDLGAPNDSYLWDRAPIEMTNLRSHPNGYFVASKDRTLYFSEPFAPWAWPTDYQIPLPAKIVGLGVFGSTIVVGTDANIYTFSGPHPTSLYKQKLSYQPCLSQRGMIETDDGVMFPASEGFQLVNQNGVMNVTADLFSPDDWADYELDTMHAVWYNKSYYGFFSDTYEGNIRIDFLNNSVTTGADYHWCGYVSIEDGVLRTIFASNIASTALYISQWDNDTSRYRNYRYKSPLFVLERPSNFKVAQVILDTDFYNAVLEIIADDTTLATLNAAEWATGLIDAPVNGSAVNTQDLNGDGLFSLSDLGVHSYVDFMLYADGVLKFTKQISDSNMFKLPRGYKDKKWEIEVTGMIPIKRITMATSSEEIS